MSARFHVFAVTVEIKDLLSGRFASFPTIRPACISAHKAEDAIEMMLQPLLHTSASFKRDGQWRNGGQLSRAIVTGIRNDGSWKRRMVVTAEKCLDEETS